MGKKTIPWHVIQAQQLSLFYSSAVSNEESIRASTVCACYYCIKRFSTSEVYEFTIGRSAICPHCGIDCLVGDSTGAYLSIELLEIMHHQWFK